MFGMSSERPQIGLVPDSVSQCMSSTSHTSEIQDGMSESCVDFISRVWLAMAAEPQRKR